MARNIFQQVRQNAIKRNAFDLSHDKKFSCNLGKLYPIMCQEVIPGDTFRNNTEFMVRFSPLLAPVMHQMDVTTHFFFVPNRIIWDGWEDFITGNNNSRAVPFFNYNDLRDLNHLKAGSLADFLGLPSSQQGDSIGNGVPVSLLPFYAYAKIFNEYYRDENLVPEIDIPSHIDGNVFSQGALAAELITIQKRAWQKDYFTSALPWAQKGDPVTLPMSGNAPVVHVESGANMYSGNLLLDGTPSSPPNNLIQNNGELYADDGTIIKASYDPAGSLYADLSNVTSATINELRQAVQLQKWLETNARSGTRYSEAILAHFGVKSSDSRLQRPEYLGGGKSPVVISEVLQTSETNTTAQGNMSGHAFSVGNSHEFNSYFEEHGFIIGMMSVIPKPAYQQGLSKLFSRWDKFDYYFPEFANLGEQEVLNQELYLASDKSENEATFGYQSRYAEYKYIPSSVHGEFKTSLNYWHMGRIFSSKPSLNRSFIECDPTTRIFAVEDGADHLYVQCLNNLRALRPMPYFGTPNGL